MREKLRRIWQGLWFLWQPIVLLTMPIWLPLRWLGEGVVAVIPPVWRFLGRMGLAIRRLFSLTFSLFVWLWRFIGRLGLATRRVLSWLIWKPVQFLGRQMSRLLRWCYRRTILATWIASYPWRRRQNRRWVSSWRIFRARVWVALRRPKPPLQAITLPHSARPVPLRLRSVRLATAVTSLMAVILLSLLTYRNQLPGRASAGSGFFLPRTVFITATPAPTTTPVPTATPDFRLTPIPTPDLLGNGGSIVFTLKQNGNSDIYVLPIGQAQPIRLTSHPAVDREAIWSPTGKQIAFTSHRDGNWEIYVYDLPSGKLNRITNSLAFEGGPGWSPDGRWLVYESDVNGSLDIYIVKVDLSEGPYRLTENPAADYAPVWSPGGRHVAFVSWRTGNKDIFLMSLDDITDETARNLTLSPDRQEDDPAFAPNGRFLAYSENSTGQPLLYALPLDEAYAPAGTPTNLGQGYHPAWSPDSQQVMAVYQAGEQNVLIAGSLAAWGVAPQAYAAAGQISQPSWAAVLFTPELAGWLQNVDGETADSPLFVEAEAQGTSLPPFKLWQLPINAPSPYLSDRVDNSFLALRERVRQEAGWDFLGQLDGMFAAIDQGVPPGENPQTWNKAGRAFDLYYRHAMGFEPTIEVVRLTIAGETYWRVYVKTAVQDGSQGEPLRELPWDFRARFGDEPQHYDQGGKWKEQIPPGYYMDFTALAADYGWEWVPAGETWRTFFPAVHFWHYENRQGLPWREAMLEIYQLEELNGQFDE